MSPFLKIMQLFLIMTGTVLGMLLLLLVTPDIEDSLLRAVARHQRRRQPSETPVHSSTSSTGVVDYHIEPKLMLTGARLRGVDMTVELDRNRKSFAPWTNSEDCNRYRIYFARPKSLPLTALVSFPGSGNTWVRYLIETASGVFTGSIYEDSMIISKGMYGEAAPFDCGCTTVQKTHASIGNTKETLAQMKTLFKGRGILLMRNPYDALLSYMNYISGGHTGFAPHDAFKGPAWETYVKKMANNWRDLAAMWINCTTGVNAMVVHFEHLRVDPRRDLRSILHFLGIAVDDGRLSCVLKHVDGHFKRQASSTQQMWFSKRDPFTKRQHQYVDNAIEFIDRLLKDRGWERVPIYLYKFYNKKRNYSVRSRAINTTSYCV